MDLQHAWRICGSGWNEYCNGAGDRSSRQNTSGEEGGRYRICKEAVTD